MMDSGAVRRVGRVLDRALSTSTVTFVAMIATMMGGGIWMLALGLERLATNQIRGGANQANAPLSYSHRYREWDALLGDTNTDQAWRLLFVTRTPSSDACVGILAALGTNRTQVRVVVVRPEGPNRPVVGSECRDDGTAEVLTGVRRQLAGVAAVAHTEGFSLFDAETIPVYGSHRLADLTTVPLVIGLWRQPKLDSAYAETDLPSAR